MRRLESDCDPYAMGTAQATALASAAVPEKMADADSAPRCIFPQIVGERSRGTTLSHSGISCRKTLRGMWRFRDHRRGPRRHRGTSLSFVVAPHYGLLPPVAHDSRLSFDVHGGRKTTDWRASLGGGDCESPWRDRP